MSLRVLLLHLAPCLGARQGAVGNLMLVQHRAEVVVPSEGDALKWQAEHLQGQWPDGPRYKTPREDHPRQNGKVPKKEAGCVTDDVAVQEDDVAGTTGKGATETTPKPNAAKDSSVTTTGALINATTVTTTPALVSEMGTDLQELGPVHLRVHTCCLRGSDGSDADLAVRVNDGKVHRFTALGIRRPKMQNYWDTYDITAAVAPGTTEISIINLNHSSSDAWCVDQIVVNGVGVTQGLPVFFGKDVDDSAYDGLSFGEATPDRTFAVAAPATMKHSRFPAKCLSLTTHTSLLSEKTDARIQAKFLGQTCWRDLESGQPDERFPGHSDEYDLSDYTPEGVDRFTGIQFRFQRRDPDVVPAPWSVDGIEVNGFGVLTNGRKLTLAAACGMDNVTYPYACFAVSAEARPPDCLTVSTSCGSTADEDDCGDKVTLDR